jgi:lysophospholipid hydrolase
MRPPVEGIGTLQFGSFEEIYELGYNYGKQFLAKLKEQKVLPVMEESGEERKLRRTIMGRRASI